jgi:hypothetical protein
MGYLLDSNVFIQAKNLHYGFDFCPGFWDWIDVKNGEGTVYSVEKVANELIDGGDDLADWAAARGADLFLPPDEPLLDALARVASWVTGHGYEPAAVNTFFQVADYYLIAHGLAHKHIVVTHEVPSGSTRKVKIPDVCIGVGVPCMSTFEMLRKERARFVLATS